MPLTEVDPNLNPRSSLSRASNFSGKTSNKGSQHGAVTDSLSTNAGVLSMLKTTTEMGDLGFLTSRPSRLPKRPAGTPRRPSNLAPSRTSSHHSYSRNSSIRSRASSNHSNPDPQMPGFWPYQHFPHASSIDLPIRDESRSQNDAASVAGGSEHFDGGQRSYSLTMTGPLQRRFSRHLPPPSLQQPGPAPGLPRSPYGYPSRTRRPSYRPVSPALSDTYAAPYNRPSAVRTAPGPRAFTSTLYPHSGFVNEQHLSAPAPRLPMSRMHGAAGVASIYTAHPVHAQPSGPDEYVSTWQSSPVQASSNNSEPHDHTLMSARSSPVPVPKNDDLLVPAGLTVRRPGDPAPYIGFVQRVKQVLEERVSTEETSHLPVYDRSRKSFEQQTDDSKAQENSPRVARRLTREMIKAAVGPASETGAMSPAAPGSIISNIDPADSTGDIGSAHAKPSTDMARSTSFPEILHGNSSYVQMTAPPIEAQVYIGPASAPPPASNISQTPAEDIGYERDEPNPIADTANDPDDDRTSSESGRETCANGDSRGPVLIANRMPTTSLVRQSKQSVSGEARQSVPVSTNSGDCPPSAIIPPAEMLPGVETTAIEAQPSISSAHSSWSTMPNSAPSSIHNFSRPGSVIDVPTWATSSILARRSFHHELSRRSVASTTFDQQLSSLSAVAGARTSLSTLGELEDVSQSTTEPTPVATVPIQPGETRLSAVRQFQFQLPDVPEDSQEESSTTNLRMLGSRPPPAFRSAGQSKKRAEARALSRLDPTANAPFPSSSYLTPKFGDTCRMPSLQFSSTDLTTKLNLALGLSALESFDEPKRSSKHNRRTVYVAPPDMIIDTRERYTSYFSGTEVIDESSELTMDLPPEKFEPDLHLIDEIDRLSIPSVNGLTVRLSELIPSIKKGDSYVDITNSETSANDETTEIRDPVSFEKMSELERKRASLISALTAGSVAQSRRGATSREPSWILPRSRGDIDVMKDLPLLPTEGKDPRPSAATVSTTHAVGKDSEERTFHRHTEGCAEETGSRPKSKARLPAIRAGDDDGDGDGETPDDTESLTTGAADLTLDVGTLEPDQVQCSAATQSEHKRKKPNSGIAPPKDATDRIIRSMSPGPHIEASLIPRSDDSVEIERSRPTRKGIIGSLRRKVGVRPSRPDPTGFSVDPEFLHPGERLVSGPGDRYPTTALTPPHHSDIDESRSFFSDSSVEEEIRTRNFRKRLTRFRMRHSTQRYSQKRAPSRAQSARETQSEPYSQYPWNESTQSLPGESRIDPTRSDIAMVYDQLPSGMSKFEFRAKRLLEKFRIFWSRSGTLIRSISRAQRKPPSYYAESDLHERT